MTDGERVYAYFGMTGVFCYDFDGNLKWQKDLGSYRMQMGYGTAGSPALDGERLYIQCDNDEKSFLVALNKKTGEEVWRKDRSEGSEALEEAGRVHRTLAADLGDALAQYAVPLAYRVRWYFRANLREIYHLCELRTTPAGPSRLPVPRPGDVPPRRRGSIRLAATPACFVDLSGGDELERRVGSATSTGSIELQKGETADFVPWRRWATRRRGGEGRMVTIDRAQVQRPAARPGQ